MSINKQGETVMRRPPSLFSPLAVIAATCCVASACNGSAGRPGAAGGSASYATNGTFTMAVSSDRGTFDPYKGLVGYASLAYDSLVNQRRDGAFVSGLAEKWQADPRSATFTLRQGLSCSDGTALTATQVADDINYVSKPKNGSVQYGVNTPTVPLTATGDDAARTVKVVMAKPYGFLLNTIGLLPIVCAKGMRDRAMLKTGSNGTGPYVLTRVDPGNSYTFTVRKGYSWGPNGAGTGVPGTPSTVVVRIVENESTVANLLLAGQVNFAKVTGQDVERLDARRVHRTDEQTSGAWLSFNQNRGRAASDRRVREALVKAVDLNAVIKVSTGGTGRPAKGLIPLEHGACPGDTVGGRLPRHDPAAAQSALDQAGWTKGDDGLRSKGGEPLDIDLVYIPTTSAFNKPTVELLAQQWRAIGVRVNIRGLALTQVVDVLYKSRNWDVYLSGWQFSLPSQLVPYLSGTVPPDGLNISGIRNADYDRLAAKAVTLLPAEGCAYWNQAEQSIVGALDVVPISSRMDYWFAQHAAAQIQRYDVLIPTSIRVFK
jgi:peptide/nickel transport system substrate-binding protein